MNRLGKLVAGVPDRQNVSFAVQKYPQPAPAKGAMVIRPDSLYRCGWHTSFGTGLFPVLQNYAGGNMHKLILAAASIAALALPGPAAAQAPIVIKFSHVVASNTPKG